MILVFNQFTPKRPYSVGDISPTNASFGNIWKRNIKFRATNNTQKNNFCELLLYFQKYQKSDNVFKGNASTNGLNAIGR